MDVIDEIIEFFKRKMRVRRFKTYRELLEICHKISNSIGGSNEKGKMNALKDIIRLSYKYDYGESAARAQLLVLKYQYVDGISRSQLRAWGTPEEFL